MKKKELVDFIVGLLLMFLAVIIILLPTFKITNIKIVLLTIFGFYTIFKIVSFILIYKEKDYESLFTSLVSGSSLIATNLIELTTKNIALILMIWMGLMSLIKLKKADFYHDRENKMWILRLLILFIFIASGLLTSINLFYDNSVQILLIGYFFLVNSILDTISPLIEYISRGIYESNK